MLKERRTKRVAEQTYVDVEVVARGWRVSICCAFEGHVVSFLKRTLGHHLEIDLLGRVCGERVCVKQGGQHREALPEPMQIRALQKSSL